MNRALVDRPTRAWRLAGGLAAWAGFLFLLMPTLIIVPISLGGARELSFPPRELSFGLYREFFTDPSWWGATLQSLKIGILTMVTSLVLAVPASYALVRGAFRGRRALNLFLVSPILVPVVVLGLGFYLQFAGLGIGGTDLSLVLAHTVLVSPFVIVSVSAGLRQIDPALETAATIMGAGRARVFLKIVLPQIRGSLAVGALFAFLLSFDEVVASYFVSGPATMTLPVKMYSALRWEISPVIAAVSAILTAISLAFSLAMLRLQTDTTGHS
ncbi:binding-protein-dependent transport systems inner membrane component [Methylobacterium sp. 4-46]|uniref:ABC transporter permease n=1 Tax=unclassified Methylobacterium TaxID=2615210 RepID=UPI000152D823|nr:MULTISPECIES: ABC transporter permease [Methylobacterium]ACA18229.1 binding-protein-dependent transport systems inner membrane component [Methylobacterium sp. 4-46]WFT77526.1 ABC transporter permease [Methylobacterium nodulans]